jgi:membrane protease YdiL (CAAX protease family)
VSRVREFLFVPRVPLWRYCLLAFPAALIPSLVSVSVAFGIFSILGANLAAIAAPDRSATAGEVFGAVVFAPIVETLLLAALLRALSALITQTLLIALASAVVWGCLHALFGFLWFFGTAWSFFIFSCGYIAWRRISFRHAFIAAAVPHALINSTALLSLLLL